MRVREGDFEGLEGDLQLHKHLSIRLHQTAVNQLTLSALCCIARESHHLKHSGAHVHSTTDLPFTPRVHEHNIHQAHIS